MTTPIKSKNRSRPQVPFGLKPLIPLTPKPSNDLLQTELGCLEKLALSASPQGLSDEGQREYARLLLQLLKNDVQLPKSKVMWAFPKSEWYSVDASLAQKSRGRSPVLIPAVLKPYIKLLKIADMAYRIKGAHQEDVGYMHSPKVLGAYQLAIECLHNIIVQGPEIAQLLTPHIHYTDGGKPKADPTNIPRLLGHRPLPRSRGQVNLQKLTQDFFIDVLTLRLAEKVIR